jgi:hypothetical protein
MTFTQGVPTLSTDAVDSRYPCVCVFVRCMRRCAVPTFDVYDMRAEGAKKIQVGKTSKLVPLLYTKRTSPRSRLPQPRLYYRLAISPRCFCLHPLLVRDTPLFSRASRDTRHFVIYMHYAVTLLSSSKLDTRKFDSGTQCHVTRSQALGLGQCLGHEPKYTVAYC